MNEKKTEGEDGAIKQLPDHLCLYLQIILVSVALLKLLSLAKPPVVIAVGDPCSHQPSVVIAGAACLKSIDTIASPEGEEGEEGEEGGENKEQEPEEDGIHKQEENHHIYNVIVFAIKASVIVKAV